MEETVARIEDRFQLVDLFFKPCDDDHQYHLLIGEFVGNSLKKVENLILKCNDFVGKERKFPSEDEINEEIRRTEVRVV